MNFRSFKNAFILKCFLTFFIVLMAGESHAQMFSVGDDDPVRRGTTPTSGLFIGLEPAKFEYKGDVTGGNAAIYEFDAPLLRLKFETVGFEAYIGTGGRITGIDDVSYFDAGIRAVRGLRIFRRPGFQASIPLMLKSSITTVSSDQFLGSGAQFQQGTLTFGGGGEIEFRASDRIRFSGRAIPNYGFSFASGGIFGGQIFELETRTRFYLDRVFGDSGLSIGWDYGFKRFDVEENEFDYNLRTHSFLIGLTF